MSGSMMLLVGIGANSFFSTILSYLKTYSSEIKDIFSLLMQGNFDHIELNYALVLSLLSFLFVLVFAFLFPYVKLLSLSQEMLYGLGISVKCLTLGFFVLMSVGISLGLMFGSSFPFVAFTSLHLMRSLYSRNSLLFLGSSILLTIAILLASDLLAHYAFSIILPTNIFVGIFGALGFVFILIKRRSS